MISRKVDRFRERKDTTSGERHYQERLETYFAESIGSNVEKLQNFAKFVPRQSITRFLSRYEIFKRVLNVQGSIVECGVLFGGGLMTYAQLSAILEPVNHQRKVIGFDTFTGFMTPHKLDQAGVSEHLHPGGYGIDSYKDLEQSAELFDSNRFLGHIPKVELIKGDIKRTVPEYFKRHPHTVISLLYLDVDLYEPTKIALEAFLPRIPKGGVIAFDELNTPNFPGETLAALEVCGLSKLRIERFSFDSQVSFAVID